MTDITSGVPIADNLAAKESWVTHVVRFFRTKPLGAIGLVVVLIFIFTAIFAQQVAPYDPLYISYDQLLSRPSWHHLLGTDEFGRDLLSRIIYGARISLLVGGSVVACSLLLGMIVGATAGYYGGRVDRFINVIVMNAFLSFPGILLAIAFVAFLGPGIFNLILALAIREHLWAVALAVPGLILVRKLISARYAALYDRTRTEGLYEITLEANRGLRRQAVLDTILDAVRRLLRSPQAAVTSQDPGPAELAASMTVAGRKHWLVASGRRRGEPFDEGDRGLLRALAAVGDGALPNAELFQQVRLERERLSSITLNIGDGVCAIDADGRLTFVNRAAADMIELPWRDISIDDPLSDGGLPAPDFLLGPAREVLRTGRTVVVRAGHSHLARRAG